MSVDDWEQDHCLLQWGYHQSLDPNATERSRNVPASVNTCVSDNLPLRLSHAKLQKMSAKNWAEFVLVQIQERSLCVYVFLVSVHTEGASIQDSHVY